MKKITLTIDGVTREYQKTSSLPIGYVSSRIHFDNDWYELVEPAKPTYEIISFKEISGIAIWEKALDGKYKSGYSRSDNSLTEMIKHQKDNIVTIHSVKRLSDGEVFTVREAEKRLGKITKIEIVEDELFLYSGNTNCVRLDYAKKVKQPTMLLTTEDEKIITDGEQMLYGVNERWERWQSIANTAQYKNIKYFSTEAARDEYILYNKPVTVTLKEYLDSNLSPVIFLKSKQSN